MISPSNLRRRLEGFLRGEGLRAFLIRGVLGSGAIKVGYSILSLSVSIVLARSLAPEGYGAYAFALSVASLLAIPAQMGLPTLVVREVARFQLKEQWGLLKGLLRRASQAVLGLSALLTLGAALVLWLLADAAVRTQVETFAWALLLVPLVALGNLAGAALRGLRKVLQGQLPEDLLRPLFLLLLAGAALAFGSLKASHAMVLHCLAAAFAFAVGAFLLIRVVPSQVRTARAEYTTAAWFRSILPLSFISGIQLINNRADIVLLGLFTGNEDVGLYRVAAQGAIIVTLPLMAINTVIAPQISLLYHAGDSERLQRMITSSARVVLAASLPLAGALIVFGALILGVVFGQAYAGGHAALAVLCLGRLVNAAVGSAGYLLNMTGHEQDTLKALAAGAVGNVLLNLVLIPTYGIEGAAVGTALSLAAASVLLYRQVNRRIGIDSAALHLRAGIGRRR